ncbi:uncharacterized protein LOC127879078 isoform X2 [Dreissena polymorpha]|uniref:uncharacterized protein LOC127879078 isoform X2 n=1 Tax=Dreissena polymorpha TaxID=45954 RepID=UPI00226556E3|nr:uncharacterized protein LOC127879078 isoform X2 [Dreissena polymorpha]
MAQSKLELFLKTLIRSNYSVEQIQITEDAEQELQLVKGSIGANISADFGILLKDVENIIRLSKLTTGFNSAKKQAKDALDKLHIYLKFLKKVLKEKPEQAVDDRNYSRKTKARKRIPEPQKQERPHTSTKRLEKSSTRGGSGANTQNDARENTCDLLERSKKAAAALVHDNPDITDLSDPNRPTKTAERFSELYDNEWTDAFEEKIRSSQVDEKIIILDLLKVVKDKTAKAVDYRNHYRKVEAQRAIPEIQQSFLESSRKSKKVIPGPKEMAFMNNCVELCWWMCIQERPVYMCNVDGDTLFNRDLYRTYTKSGTQLDYIVWPALTLYEDPRECTRTVLYCIVGSHNLCDCSAL